MIEQAFEDPNESIFEAYKKVLSEEDKKKKKKKK
jgi:hypothetical protein